MSTIAEADGQVDSQRANDDATEGKQLPPTAAPCHAHGEFFLVDEMAMLRFVSMCQESYTPELWESLDTACRTLISIRPGLRDDSFERIEAYLRGENGK